MIPGLRRRDSPLAKRQPQATPTTPELPPLFARFALALAFIAAIAIASVAALAPTTRAFAQTGTYIPDTPADPVTEARLRHLAEELRCLVCQNQTIADSSADLAVDLRRVVRAQILEGKSDDAIKQYLVDRYGDFVLYRPPMQANTVLLWLGPFALLAIGFGVWWMIGRRKATAADAATSTDDTNSARALLDEAEDAPPV